jgi:cyclopropane-fatty-acyl-phospholipid synthase
MEEGGRIFTFEGNKRQSSLKVVLKVHRPQFYWKVCTMSSEFGMNNK